MTRFRPELLAAASGLLLVLSFPKLGHWAFGWVALAPLLLALHEARGWRAARLGYLTGAVSGLGLLYWTALVVTQYGGLSLPVATVIMSLLCLAVALFPHLLPARRDALLDLLDALCSSPQAQSGVELSLCPLFRREYGKSQRCH